MIKNNGIVKWWLEWRFERPTFSMKILGFYMTDGLYLYYDDLLIGRTIHLDGQHYKSILGLQTFSANFGNTIGYISPYLQRECRDFCEEGWVDFVEPYRKLGKTRRNFYGGKRVYFPDIKSVYIQSSADCPGVLFTVAPKTNNLGILISYGRLLQTVKNLKRCQQ